MMSIKTDQGKRKRLESKLKEAGFDIKYRTKDELRLQKCPLHRDRTPSLSINVEKEIFKCQSCGLSGRISKLLKEYGIEYGFYNQAPELSELEALFLESISPKKLITVSGENSAEDDAEKYKANIKDLEKYRYYHPYLETRGFSKKFILKNKIGFDKKELRVTIPIFLFGNYYGCARRSAVSDTPKIKYDEGMPKDQILYLPLTNTHKSETFLISEGPIDALKASYYGQDVGAILGCQCSDKQLELIYEFAGGREIVLGLDADNPGKEGIERILRMVNMGLDNLSIFYYDNSWLDENGKCDLGMLTREQFNLGMENRMSILEWY